MSVFCNACIVAKQYILSKNFLNKQIVLSEHYPLVLIWTLYGPYFPPNRDTDFDPKYLHSKL